MNEVAVPEQGTVGGVLGWDHGCAHPYPTLCLVLWFHFSSEKRIGRDVVKKNAFETSG